MEAALEESESQRLHVVAQRDKFRGIYDAGLVKEGPDGNYTVVNDPTEQE